jgi:MFS family permease
MIFCLANYMLDSSIGVSILFPAYLQVMEEFEVSSMVVVLPLSLHVLALGLGPLIGGLLSETVGRYPVYVGTLLLSTVRWYPSSSSHITHGVTLAPK